jgi:hypothetical protein
MWEIRTTDPFDAWFARLDADCQVEVIAKVNLLKLRGPRLSQPHADTLKGSKHAHMKELRGHTCRAVLRIAFAFDPQRQGILLVGGNKSGVHERPFYRQLIAKADELYDRHLADSTQTGDQ